MEYIFSNKEEMLSKFRAFKRNPDDDNILIKNKIYDILYHSPEILFLLNNTELQTELFDEDGDINIDEDGEPLGTWDEYFGETSNIRPYLFFPDVQAEGKNYICYTIGFNDPFGSNRVGNRAEKNLEVKFTILVYAYDAIEPFSGLPRHDLIASIIREKFAWSGFMMSSAVPTYDQETVTDNNYIVRTISFSAKVPNALVSTNESGSTFWTNKGKK